MIKVFAPAKLNLTLKILNRFENGYHNIESIIAFASIGDTILIKRNKKFKLRVIGPEYKMLLKEKNENLIRKTIFLLSQKTGIDTNVKITLIKRLPTAAGLGGGSADAAATLRGMLMLNKNNIQRRLIEEIASDLGSDILACLYSKTLFIKGKGNEIETIPNITRGLWAVIVNPRIATYTKDIFNAHNTSFSKSVRPVKDKSYLEFHLRKCGNDLTKTVNTMVPETNTILNVLSLFPKAKYTRISGSGSSVFSLFKNSKDAYKVASFLKNRRKKWWISAVPLLG